MSEGTPDTGAEERDPSFSEAFSAALGAAASRSGMSNDPDASAGAVAWSAVGGWRGIVESTVPSLAFVVSFVLTGQNLMLALAISVGLAIVFTVIRLGMRQTPLAAISGLVATVAAALLAIWTGRGADNFVLGFFTNGAYAAAFLISVLVGWPIIGVIVGYLMGEGTAWRGERRKRRAFLWLSLAWAGLFLLRLAVQLPVYFAAINSGDPLAGTEMLGILKLVMGLPIFAPLVAVTWLVSRSLYAGASRRAPSEE